MSALAKLYASRGLNIGENGIPNRSNQPSTTSLSSNTTVMLRRRADDEKPISTDSKVIVEKESEKSNNGMQNYTDALDVLEHINSGFADVFERLKNSEAMKDQLASECEKQDSLLREYLTEIENIKQHYEQVELQNADIAEQLIAERSRASNAEHRSDELASALNEAQIKIKSLEEICKTLHDGIFAVFGVGSPMQKAISTLNRP